MMSVVVVHMCVQFKCMTPQFSEKGVFFFAVSLPQQLQCDNQQRLVEKKKKKGHVSLQQHSASTQKRKHMRAKERAEPNAKCFCTRGSAYQPVPVDKQQNHTLA